MQHVYYVHFKGAHNILLSATQLTSRSRAVLSVIVVQTVC